MTFAMKVSRRLVRELEKLANGYLERTRTGVLHIGANVGNEAPFYKNDRVVWVEANPALMDRLRENIKPYPRQVALCALLGDRQDEVDSHIASNQGQSSSILEFGEYSAGEKSLWPRLNLHITHTVHLQMQTLDSLVASQMIDLRDFDYWVVDVQGAELLVLDGATDNLRHCKAMKIEISTVDVYKQGARYEDIRAKLGDLGFFPLTDPYARNIRHGDITFVRRSLSRGSLPIWMLAFLSDRRDRRAGQAK
jgi:FkbM family methyltransferase